LKGDKVVDKKALIAEIELFGKLDVKYVLEALPRDTFLPIVYGYGKSVKLSNNNIEFFKECLYTLIELDDDFSKDFFIALNKVSQKNKVANIDKQNTSIAPRDIELLYYLLKQQTDSTEIKALTQTFKRKFFILDDEIIKFSEPSLTQMHYGDGDNIGGDKIIHDRSVNVDGSNTGVIVTGDHNTVIHHKEVDFNKKLERELNRLTVGNMAFNTPQEMFYDETKEVTLRIFKEIILVNDLPQENQTIQQEIKISKFMKAILISNDFDIMAPSSEEQIIDNISPTEWKWYITPKSSKKEAKIYLTVTVRIPLFENREEKKDIAVFVRNINILLK